MTEDLSPAFVGQVSWTGSCPARDDTDWGSSHIRIHHRPTAMQAGHLSRFHLHANGRDLWVTCFGRVCHWPGIDLTTDAADYPARLFAETYTADRPFPPEVAGDFAVVIWDQQHQELILARDHMGTRPLFYTRTADGLAFGSDIAGLCRFCTAPDTLWRPAVIDYLTAFKEAEHHRTARAAICRVLPATWHRFREGTSTATRYWQFGRTSAPTGKSDAEIYETGRNLLERAVSERVSAYTIDAVHLSGGLDSSALAALTVKQCRRQGKAVPTALTWQPPPTPDKTHVDQELISQFAADLGMDLVFSGPTPDSVTAFLDLDPIDYAPSSELIYEIAAQRARHNESGLIMSGWGGDQALSFHGRSPARALLPNGLLRLWDRFRAGKARRPGSYALVPDTAGRDPQKTLDALLRQSTHETQIAKLSTGYIQDRMECWSIYAARYDIQYCYPLADWRLIDFALSVPARLFRKPLGPRSLMRMICAADLDPAIRLRPEKSDPSLHQMSGELMVTYARILQTRLDETLIDPERAELLQLGRLEKDVARAADSAKMIRGKMIRAAGVALGNSRRGGNRG